MPVYNVPKVYTSEIDLTTTVGLADGSTYAGFCGNFAWGPCELPTLITSENDLVDVFGKPNDETYVSFFSAANFLTYSSSLRVVRGVDDAAKNAVSGSTAVLVKNTSHYNDEMIDSLTGSGKFIAKYPGELGNSLFVAVCDSDVVLSSNVHSTSNNSLGTWSSYFITAPGTSENASAMGGSNDEMHVLVFDAEGKLTGTKGTLLEKYEYVSKAKDAKLNGVTNYFKEIINGTSSFIRCGDEFPLGANATCLVSDDFDPVGNSVFQLALGVDVDGEDDAIYTTGYELFSDKKTIDVSHFITADHSATVVDEVVTIAENRGDAVVFVSPQWTDVQPGKTQSEITEACKTYKNTTIGRSSSYMFMDNNWAYQYDKYNDLYRWIPCNSHVAGLSSRTDLTSYEWYSIAGYTRGLLNRVERLAWNPKEQYVGELYGNFINSIVLDETNGIVLMGDKTALNRNSAFDRIGVRKLFNVLKKKVADYLKFILFEINDEFTRDQITAMLNAFLNQVKGLRGIYDFQVVCNATNNTGAVIDSNTLVCDIYIKPTKSINYVQLNMIATGTSVDFNEIVGRF